MVGIQWHLTSEYESLPVSHIAELIHGYNEVRPFTEMEWRSFPIVWASYYADRMTFLFHRRLQGTQYDDVKRLRAHLLNLPLKVIAFGEEITEAMAALSARN